MATEEKKKCVICGEEFTEWGNNPWPVANTGCCCDFCNATVVVPARFNRMRGKLEE